MYQLPERPMFRALGVTITALTLLASGAALAQSSPSTKPANALDAASAQQAPASSVALTANAVLSDSVGFDVMAQDGLRAEVIPGVNPTFRYKNGWNSVTRVGTGHYCLNGGFVNGSQYNYPAVVSVQSLGSPVIGIVQYDSGGISCPGVGVYTFLLS
jgi:hypothetical protein